MNLQGVPPQVLVPVGVAFVAGLVAFVRGLSAYRQGARVSSIATSRVASLAAGEVRLTGVVEPIVTTLVSPLQSQPCVWYRAHAREIGDNGRTLLREERAVEFALRDATGHIRVIPRDARWLIQDAFDETTDFLGGEPPGLDRRLSPATTVVPEADREAAIAALLTVRPARSGRDDDDTGGIGLGHVAGLGEPLGPRTRYQEARIAPGDTITLMGYAQPFSDAFGPGGDGAVSISADPVDALLAADLEAARESGTLAASAAEAWGNAAIPGFGIGRPVAAPQLHPDATPLPTGDSALTERAEQLFEVPDQELIVTGHPSVPLTIYAGTPVDAEDHHDRSFLLGLGSAILATVSVLVAAVLITGNL